MTDITADTAAPKRASTALDHLVYVLRENPV